MLEEGVKQYFIAKRIASKRLLGRDGAARTRFRPTDLPSNGEIREALLELADRSEGSRRTARLFAMRAVALQTMRALEGFEPRLIGSVSTGHVRRGSDIDLSIFTRDDDALERRMTHLGWNFEREVVSIRKAGRVAEYVHYHLDDVFPIELTLYDPMDLRLRPRSSTDGKPIQRMRVDDVVALLERDHPDAWAEVLEDGRIPGLDAIVAADRDDTRAMPALGFDGWLEDG